MRTKNFIFVLCFVILCSILLIILGPGQNENIENIKNIVSQQIKENLQVDKEKELDIDLKYLKLLGFNNQIQNVSKLNFSIVSYVQSNQIASAILHLKNVASVMPTEQLLIYDLGLNEADLLTLAGYCNHSKCAIISYDFSQYPSYIMNIDDKTHLFRAIIIKDALNRSKTILFTENYIRLRGSSQAFNEIRKRTENKNGVISLAVKKLPVSSSTHPKLFEYYNSNADSFLFVRLVSLDICFFHYSKFLDDKIMLPWLKCVLTQNCIAPIGASGSISNHCKFNKKPSYRYSGCHSFESSAFNVVLGLAFNFNEAKYSISDDNLLFYKQTLEESNKILDNKRRNISDTTSDHPYSSDE